MDPPMNLAVEMALVDVNGEVSWEETESTRAGYGRTEGRAYIKVSAYRRKGQRVSELWARVLPGTPPWWPGVEVPVRFEEELMTGAGVTVQAVEATCRSEKRTGAILLSVRVRVQAPVGEDLFLRYIALDEAGMPMVEKAEYVFLDEDPDQNGEFVAAEQIEVSEVPDRVIVARSGAMREWEAEEPEKGGSSFRTCLTSSLRPMSPTRRPGRRSVWSRSPPSTMARTRPSSGWTWKPSITTTSSSHPVVIAPLGRDPEGGTRLGGAGLVPAAP
ncbi:hypothetical protein JK386_04905 [Nocardioides sp. zg-536]|uniref:Uncharacterized protein n=1 Tax=Nocardioides faecalis TaxID=2803858 RepID=A0A938Y4U8_9ACTN|nr:hypothetical protein [Nocardioides faecalis]MBM9459232.1 hypothetical protein [Nocardioides faecalis]QVI59633.1 hypothetical protein KG111_04610 [Nocardioides faecalis]